MVTPDGANDGAVLRLTHLFASFFLALLTNRVIVGCGESFSGGVWACGGGGAAVSERHGARKVSR